MTQLVKHSSHAYYILYSFYFLYKQNNNEQTPERLSAFQTNSLNAVIITVLSENGMQNLMQKKNLLQDQGK